MDIALDKNTHDLLIKNGDLQLVSGGDQIAQHLKIRLWLFQGEIIFDTSLGVPYYSHILVKNPDIDIVESVLRETILETPGITGPFSGFNLSWDTSLRELDLTFEVEGTNGPISFSEVLT